MLYPFYGGCVTGGIELSQVIVGQGRSQRSLDSDFDGQTVAGPADLVVDGVAAHPPVTGQQVAHRQQPYLLGRRLAGGGQGLLGDHVGRSAPIGGADRLSNVVPLPKAADLFFDPDETGVCRQRCLTLPDTQGDRAPFQLERFLAGDVWRYGARHQLAAQRLGLDIARPFLHDQR